LAKRQGLASAGPDGLLKQFTRTVPETALDEEMSEHPDHPKHEKTKDGRAGNARNGATRKTVITDASGPVGIEVPRGRDASFA
jgi:transposase-like protein